MSFQILLSLVKMFLMRVEVSVVNICPLMNYMDALFVERNLIRIAFYAVISFMENVSILTYNRTVNVFR